MKPQRFPPGWDEKRVREVIDHYESQTEEEAVAEAETAFSDPNSTVMVVPRELVSQIDALIAKHEAAKRNTAKPKPPSKKRKPRVTRE